VAGHRGGSRFRASGPPIPPPEYHGLRVRHWRPVCPAHRPDDREIFGCWCGGVGYAFLMRLTCRNLARWRMAAGYRPAARPTATPIPREPPVRIKTCARIGRGGWGAGRPAPGQTSLSPVPFDRRLESAGQPRSCCPVLLVCLGDPLISERGPLIALASEASVNQLRNVIDDWRAGLYRDSGTSERP
jgi:hypothetical protein